MKQELDRREQATTLEKSRGRVERRTVTTTTSNLDTGHLDWPGVQQLIRLERVTVEKGQERRSTTYAITSLPREKADASFLLRHLRGRWAIENRCFHVLDTQLREDHCRIRTGTAAHVLSAIRHATLNLARKLHTSVTTLCQQHAARTDILLQRLRILKN